MCSGNCGTHTQLMFYNGFFVEVTCKACNLYGFKSSHEFMREMIRNNNKEKNKSLSWSKVAMIKAKFDVITPSCWTGIVSLALRGEELPVIHYWYNTAAGRDFANVTYMPVFDAMEVLNHTEKALEDAIQHYTSTDEPHMIMNAKEIANYNRITKVTSERTIINTTDKLIKELNNLLK